MVPSISTSKQFFLWDYDSTLFPLRINRLLVEHFSRELLGFIQEEKLTSTSGFQAQHRVFATKRGWFLRPTVKLDPVAEFFFYDFVYRQRNLFRKTSNEKRIICGYRIVGGEPIPILDSYSQFKKAVAKHRSSFENYVYFDVSAYFNRIYHHDLVRWCEDAGANKDDVRIFGKFLRDTSSGRSINCLPQGIYPSKMIGNAFLRFLESLGRFGCAFKASAGVFSIDWRGKSLDAASKAEILAAISRIDTEVGQLVILAFEISPVRPLPHYCYFPFDWRNQSHKKCLKRLSETGEIRICFRAERNTVYRTHRLTPYFLSRAGCGVWA